jgi:hypothetical protein
MKTISEVIVQAGASLRGILVSGDSEVQLGVGRYECVGCFERNGIPFVWLRSGAGEEYIVSKWDLYGAERLWEGIAADLRKIARGQTAGLDQAAEARIPPTQRPVAESDEEEADAL